MDENEIKFHENQKLSPTVGRCEIIADREWQLSQQRKRRKGRGCGVKAKASVKLEKKKFNLPLGVMTQGR